MSSASRRQSRAVLTTLVSYRLQVSSPTIAPSGAASAASSRSTPTTLSRPVGVKWCSLRPLGGRGAGAGDQRDDLVAVGLLGAPASDTSAGAHHPHRVAEPQHLGE